MATRSKKVSLPKDIQVSLKKVEADLKKTIGESNVILEEFKKEIESCFKDPKEKSKLLKDTFFWESRNKIMTMKMSCLNSYHSLLLKRGELEGGKDEGLEEGETLLDFIS